MGISRMEFNAPVQTIEDSLQILDPLLYLIKSKEGEISIYFNDSNYLVNVGDKIAKLNHNNSISGQFINKKDRRKKIKEIN